MKRISLDGGQTYYTAATVPIQLAWAFWPAVVKRMDGSALGKAGDEHPDPTLRQLLAAYLRHAPCDLVVAS